jgi:hypothetical protein
MLPVDLNAESGRDGEVAALYGALVIGAALARANLSPKRLISHYRMNAAALAHVEQVLTQRYHAALCSPSDMVGIVATVHRGAQHPDGFEQRDVGHRAADLHRRRADQDDHRGSRTVHGEHGGRPTWRRTHRTAAWIKDRDPHRLHRRGGPRTGRRSRRARATRSSEDGSNTVYE